MSPKQQTPKLEIGQIRKAEENLDNAPSRVVELADLLEEVRTASPEKLASSDLQQKIWFGKDIWENRKAQGKVAVRDPSFRDWFVKTIQTTWRDAPADGLERTNALTDLLVDIRAKIRSSYNRKLEKVPLLEPLRALAMFFPSDFTGVADPDKLNDLRLALAIDRSGMYLSERWCVETNRKILEYLDDTIQSVDPNDFTAVARRMLLTVDLHTTINPDPKVDPGLIPFRSESSDGPQNDAVVLPSLNELTNRVLSAAENEGLQFKVKDIESLHCGLWADKRRHFAVLSGLSGTGKTKIARLYAEALIPNFEGNDDSRLRVIPVQPG